jgi:hypothetical protein
MFMLAAHVCGNLESLVARWVVAEDVGIETLGGVFTPLIKAGACIPCTTTLVFSTAEDNQMAVTLKLAQGRGSKQAENRSLGSFDLTGIPPAARGLPQIAVTIAIDEDGAMSLTAVDQATERSQTLRVSAQEDHRVKLRDADSSGGRAPALHLGLAVGVKRDDGSFITFFPAGTPVPASAKVQVPTTRDAQTEMQFWIAERDMDPHGFTRSLSSMTVRLAGNTHPAGRVGVNVEISVSATGQVQASPQRAGGTGAPIVAEEKALLSLAGAWLDAEPAPAAPATSPGASVFISHASPDAARAMQLVTGLEASGARCWVAPRDVRPGADYRAAILEAIKSSTHCVLVLSDAANASPHVLREISLADQYSKSIVVVRDNASPMRPEFEYLLAGLHWVTWENARASGFKSLL